MSTAEAIKPANHTDQPESRNQVPEPTPVIQAVLDEGFPNLRYYQRDCVICAAERVRQTRNRLLMVLPTGAGKSWIIAALAQTIKEMANARSTAPRRVLVLQPNAEVAEQNHEKMTSAGYQASVFSASANSKCMEHQVIFATPQTVSNALESFTSGDSYAFAAVFIDEAHSHPPTVLSIIEALSDINPNLRVIGLTATPYKMNRGYIYRENTYLGHPPLTERHTIEPYFDELIYEISTHELIAQGYLIPPVLRPVDEGYDTSRIKLQATGKPTKQSADEVFNKGQGERNKRIVKEIKSRCKGRKAIMIFAQNIELAEAIKAQLPDGNSVITHSKMHATQAKQAIQDFQQGKYRYIVNVGKLTTGFDATRVDAIVLLRYTDSVSLLQQIIGRGLRPYDDSKGIPLTDCLVLDFAQNFDRWAPDGDVFNPRIDLTKKGDGGLGPPMVDVQCPSCGGINVFRKAAEMPGAVMNEHGFLVADSGEPVLSSSGKRVSGHLGRQCNTYTPNPDGTQTRCEQTWLGRLCPNCGEANEPTAHYCESCDAPVSKSARRIQASAGTPSVDPYQPIFARVLDSQPLARRTSKRGNETLMLSIQVKEMPFISDPEDTEQSPVIEDPEPRWVRFWITPGARHRTARQVWLAFRRYVVAIAGFSDDADDQSVVRYVREQTLPAPAKVIFSEYTLEGRTFAMLRRLQPSEPT